MKPRICENCKWFDPPYCRMVGNCVNDDCQDSRGNSTTEEMPMAIDVYLSDEDVTVNVGLMVHKNFCCALWEGKK